MSAFISALVAGLGLGLADIGGMVIGRAGCEPEAFSPAQVPSPTAASTTAARTASQARQAVPARPARFPGRARRRLGAGGLTGLTRPRQAGLPAVRGEDSPGPARPGRRRGGGAPGRHRGCRICRITLA